MTMAIFEFIQNREMNGQSEHAWLYVNGKIPASFTKVSSMNSDWIHWIPCRSITLKTTLFCILTHKSHCLFFYTHLSSVHSWDFREVLSHHAYVTNMWVRLLQWPLLPLLDDIILSWRKQQIRKSVSSFLA